MCYAASVNTPAPAQGLAKRRADWEKSLESPSAKYAEAFNNWSTIVAGAVERDIKEHPERLDSWTNALTGIGTSRDKMTASSFAGDGLLPFGVLEDLYHNDDMAARGVDAIPEQMLREGFEISVKDNAETGDQIEKFLESLDVIDKFEEALIWGRLYGGSLLLVGANDGASEPAQPLNENKIQSIDFLTPIDRFSVFPVKWYDDALKPKYGEPEVYRFLLPTTPNPGGIMNFQVGQEVHETRLIRFRGARTSIRRRRVNFGWDDSVLQRVYSVLLAFGMNWASVTHLLSDVAQGVMKIKNLASIITGNAKDTLRERAALADETRSVARVLMLDADSEDFTRVPTPFNGIPDLLDRTGIRLSAAFGMPVTKLLGISPGGLNATGESDIRNWYDEIAAKQPRVLTPRLNRLIRLSMLAKNGPTGGKLIEDFNITYRPLWQLGPTEEADRRKTVAETDEIYIDKGVQTAEETAESRFQPTGYSAETTVDLELRDQLKEQDAQAAQLGAGKATAEQQATETAPDPATDAPVVADPNAEAKDPTTALNGAQISSLLDIVNAVAAEELPRESAIAMIVASFPISPEVAEEILGKVGKTFFAKPEPPPQPFGGGPPKPGGAPPKQPQVPPAKAA